MSESPAILEAQTPRPHPKHSSHPILKLLFVTLQYVVVIVVPFTFLIYLFARETPLVFKKTTENPQYTIVVVTVVSSLWTWLAKQLFSTIVEWFAVVKLGDEVKKSDVIFFAALKTGTALVKKNRRLQSLTTWLAVAVLALLSAGYTTLLVPLPVTFFRSTQGWEPDFLAQDSTCPGWFQSHYDNVSTEICSWETIDGVDLSTCPSDNFNDLLASALNGLSNDPNDIIPAAPTILWGIGAVPFSGGTGGVIPQGPGSEPYVDTTGSWLNESTTSSIPLQGLTTNVTCQNVSTVPITLDIDDDSLTAIATVTCPDGSSRQWLLPFSDTGLAAIDCPGSPNVDNSGENLLYIMTLGPIPPHVPSFGNLTCHITASIAVGELTQRLSDSGEVFTWQETEDPPKLPPAFDIAGQSVGGLSAALLTGQTETGNDFLGTFQTLFLSIGSDNASVPTLVSYMLAGVITYEASFIRRLFALSLRSETQGGASNIAFQSIPAPNTPCIRPFTLDYWWDESGWQAHSQLFISFVSIGLVGLAVLGMFIWILLHGSKGLNGTDVLDPVVLLGKTAHIVKKEMTKEFEEEEKEIKESALDEIKELGDDDDREPARKSRRMKNRDWSGITDFFS